VGVCAARRDKRPLVLVGDGAFQMTGTEISTLARLGSNAIVIVFNNSGYSTERFILDGPFNDIHPWSFHRLAEVLGPLEGRLAATEEEFEKALQQSLATLDRPSLIEVTLPARDPSPAMKRLAENLKAIVDGKAQG
ncbi:MAG: thiamine pyrophosphate-dependent enzyme, partial [Candidatus Binatia bacterium]